MLGWALGVVRDASPSATLIIDAVILTIAASFALGAALEETGAAAYMAEGILAFSAGQVLLTLFLVYCAVSFLTEA